MTSNHTLSGSRTRSGQPTRLGRRWLVLAAMIAAFLFLAGCDKTGDMSRQPRLNPLSASEFLPNGQAAQVPVAGSVPYSATTSPNAPELTGMDTNGQALKGWPVTVDKALVQKGQDQYNIFCIPCHGPTATGNGKVTGFGFPKPPSLLDAPAKGLTNGEIFGVILNGKGKMFSYGYRVKAPERWAIIAYLRAMQMKNGAVDPQGLTPADLSQIGNQQ